VRCLGARRGDDEEAELGRVAVEGEQALDGVGRGVVQVVHPEQDRAVLADALEGAADDEPAQLGAIEGEALARGPHAAVAQGGGRIHSAVAATQVFSSSSSAGTSHTFISTFSTMSRSARSRR
jgi:hypothetical protein